MPKYILLADDSVTIQKVVELTFSEGDYQVTCVSNGRLALQKIQEKRPDILLCDVIMPELNGYEVCSAVKHTPDLAGIPVVLMTGTFEPFDEEKARQAGADTFVTKPFESKLLVEKVEELLKKRMVLDTTVPMENAQVFHSRQEFTLQAPAPSDEELLAAERGTDMSAAGFESPFLPAPETKPEPVGAAAPHTAPPAFFVPPPPAPPPAEGAFEEVFASPPTMAPPEPVAPPHWEPPVQAAQEFQPVTEVPSPAESLFQAAPTPPPEPDEASFLAPAAEPELPPFDGATAAEPLEVVHDMMDQEDMVSRAQSPAQPAIPDAEPEMPAFEGIDEAPPLEMPYESLPSATFAEAAPEGAMPPFEGSDEAPPLEMPYESLAPASYPPVSTVEFPGAPEPSEAEVPLTPVAFGSSEATPSPPPPEAADIREEMGAEALFEAEPVESYPPAEEPFREPEVESPAMEFPPAPPEALEAQPPVEVVPSFEAPAAFVPEEAFVTAPEEEFPPRALEEDRAPAWQPSPAPEAPATPAEEAFVPAAEAEAAQEPVPAAEVPSWAAPVAAEFPPVVPQEAPPWEPPLAQEVPPFQPQEPAAPAAFEPAPEEVPAPPAPAMEVPSEADALFPAAEEEEYGEEPAFPPEPPMPEETPAEFTAPAFEEPTEVPEEPAASPVEPPPSAVVAPVWQEPAPHPVAPAPSPEELEAAIRKVVAEMAPEILRQVAWEVIPELAESLIKRRIRELESAEE